MCNIVCMENALEAANAKSLFVFTNLNNWTSPFNALPGLFGDLLFIVYFYVGAYSIFLFFFLFSTVLFVLSHFMCYTRRIVVSLIFYPCTPRY